MTNMAASISGGLKASQLASGIKASLGAVGKMVSAPAKELWDKTAGAKMRELDAHYFDSGKLADERRKQKEQENAQMASHKKAFVSAGDQAVKEHLRKNAAELFAPGVTKEQRDKELTKVRDEAMAKEGKKRGLTDDQINKVKNDKGFKYEGSNVLAGGWQAMKQGLTASGSFKTSIGERKVNSELSAKDAREALKNTDSVGREQFLKAVASGDVSVKKSGWEGFKDKAKTAGKVAAGVATGGLAPAAMALSKYAKDAAEYKEAREQLVSEGVVPKMALGVYSALPSEMKDKIRARRDVNRAQKDDGAKKRPSANTEAKLRIESQMLDEKESGGEGEFVRDQDSAAAMGIGRERDLFALMKRGDVAKQIKKERAALSKTELLSRRDQAKANLVSAEEEYDKYDDDVETTKNDPEYKEKEHLMTQCRGKIADPKLSREERNEARKTLSTLKKDPEFTAKVTKLKKDIVSRNQAYNKAQNYGKAVESLEIQVAEMEGASSGPVVTIKDPYDDGDDNKGKDSKDGDA